MTQRRPPGVRHEDRVGRQVPETRARGPFDALPGQGEPRPGEPGEAPWPVATLEFFFDCASPWTYLAFHRIEAVAGEAGAELVWRPILVGGVFNEVNRDVYDRRARPNPRIARYMAKDLQDWAREYGIEIGWPSVFPVNSVRAMRGALLAQDAGRLPAYARAVFEAYWGRDEDVSRVERLADLAEDVGLERAAFLAGLEAPAVKARLRANTDELIERGGYGSPTMFVDGDDMYFGNDRLPLVAAALRRAGGRGAPRV